MKLFSGFPSGKLDVTPLPNLFFSELLPAIDDVAELKVTLQIIWLTAHSKAAFVRASDLRADRTLMQALKSADELARALALAVARGTLLHLPGDDALYFLNTERGRTAFEKAEAATPTHELPHEPATVTERPNIFSLYEQNIGLLTPLIADELKEAEETYSAAWVAEALKLAVENNKRSWSYARKILQRWKEQGRAEPSKKKKWYGDEYGKLVKR